LLENPADPFLAGEEAVAQFPCHGDGQVPKGWGAVEQFRDGRSESLRLLPKCKWLAARKLITIRNLQIRTTNVDPEPST
jgi:hypothetical protein